MRSSSQECHPRRRRTSGKALRSLAGNPMFSGGAAEHWAESIAARVTCAARRSPRACKAAIAHNRRLNRPARPVGPRETSGGGLHTRQLSFAIMTSLWSTGSILSIASDDSILSIGSVGSVLSVGSVGSACSILSVGSAGSIASALSFASTRSVLSARSSCSALGVPISARRRQALAIGVLALGFVLLRGESTPADPGLT